MPAPNEWRGLLDLAHDDLRALGAMLDPTLVSDAIFAFHAQQAVEKALKAWIGMLGHPWPFVHDLGALLERLSELECDVAAWAPLTWLTAFGVETRYTRRSAHDAPIDRDALARDVGALLVHVDSISKQQ
jgi:hypothetical protein